MPAYPKFLQANVGNMMPVVEQNFSAPIAAATNNLKDKEDISTTVVNITTFLIQPDYPRKIKLTGHCEEGNPGYAGTLTILGKDIAGKVISEDIAVAQAVEPAADAVYTSLKAYATLTSIKGTLVGATTADLLCVGLTNAFKLMYKAKAVTRELSAGVPQAIAATLDKVANTYTPTVTPNATLSFQLWYTRAM